MRYETGRSYMLCLAQGWIILGDIVEDDGDYVTLDSGVYLSTIREGCVFDLAAAQTAVQQVRYPDECYKMPRAWINRQNVIAAFVVEAGTAAVLEVAR